MDISSPSLQPYQLIYPSLAQCFANSLAIAAQTLNLTSSRELFPIHVEATPHVGQYRSAIALSLAPTDKATLAQELGAIAQSYLNKAIGSSGEEDNSEEKKFVVLSQGTGWINLTCSLGLQLAFIAEIGTSTCKLFPHLATQCFSDGCDPHLLFELQYAHARCCSQLKLAQTSFSPEHLLPLEAIASWLCAYFKVHNSAQSIERELWLHLLNFSQALQTQTKLKPSFQDIPQLANVTPALSMSPWVNLPLHPKRLQFLSQTWVKLFQKFYSHCRLVEISQPEQQHLLTLRLALLSGLKTVLNFILTQLIGVSAPHSL